MSQSEDVRPPLILFYGMQAPQPVQQSQQYNFSVPTIMGLTSPTVCILMSSGGLNAFIAKPMQGCEFRAYHTSSRDSIRIKNSGHGCLSIAHSMIRSHHFQGLRSAPGVERALAPSNKALSVGNIALCARSESLDVRACGKCARMFSDPRLQVSCSWQ